MFNISEKTSMRSPCFATARVFLLLFVLSMSFSLVLPPASVDAGNYHTKFMADKVVRLWFQRHDGVQVYEIVEKLNYTNRLMLWQNVREHPYVEEIMDGLHSPRQRMLYQGLAQTFADLLR